MFPPLPADMFAGERLRCDLRDLQRLCNEIKSCIGEVLDVKRETSPAVRATPNSPPGLNLELLQAVHERTLLAGSLLLRGLESLRPSTPAAAPAAAPATALTCLCVSRPPDISAAPLVALLWAEICQFRAQICQAGDGSLASFPSRVSASCATQTEDSCLRRCESCWVAEATIKTLVQTFCAELDEPSVAEQRTEVAASLCSGRLSQWGAMRALTSALCHDLDALLRSKGAALAALEVESSAAKLARRDANQARDRARSEEDERAVADQRRHVVESKLADLEASERDWRSDVASFTEAVEAARVREADLNAQMLALRADFDHAVQELELSRRRAEVLQTEQRKLRKQVKLSQERHALLLRYPDLHGPLQPLQHEAGDPVLDMECQVRANEVRVSLLTKQNERLRATIDKMRVLAASGRPPTRNHSRPTSASSPCPSPSPPTSSAALQSNAWHAVKNSGVDLS